MLFSDRDLRQMIVPLFFEQLLVMLVGIAWAMCFNWVATAIVFFWRLRSGRWKGFRVI